MRCVLTVLLLTSVAVGCAEGPASVDQVLRVTEDTVGGVVQVRNSGNPPEWRLEPVLRLGTVEGGPEQFGRIRSLVADGEGNVYIAENFAHEVRVFGPDGNHIRTIGRQGQGPGEFGDLYSLAWLGENLAAMDPANARIATLSRGGEWLGSTQHFAITGPASIVRLHPVGTEGFYAPFVDSNRSGLPFFRVTTSGSADTIPAPQRPDGAESTGVVCHRPDGGIQGISLPDGPGLTYAFPPAGGVVAVSWTDEYRINLLHHGGDTLRVITRERPGIPYPDSLWHEVMEPFLELRENFPGARCEPSSPERPRYRAPLRHLVFDVNGELWVEAAVEDGFQWDVFDANGRLLGSAKAPARAQRIPPYVRDGYLYQVEVDEMGVEHVGVYRLAVRS